MKKVLRYEVKSTTGWDWFLELLLPRAWFLKHLRGRLLKGPWRGIDPNDVDLCLLYRGEGWQLLSKGMRPAEASMIIRPVQL